MCMSTVYERKDGNDTLICEDVREARVEDNQVTLVDIMGYAVTVNGVIKKVDLIKNTMFIEPV